MTRRVSRVATVLTCLVLGLFARTGRAEHAYVLRWNPPPFQIVVFDTATCAIANTIPTPVAGWGVAAGSKRVYVTLPDQKEVWVIDDPTGQVVGKVSAATPPRGVALLPDESKVFVTSEAGNVFVIDAATLAVTSTLPVGGAPFSATTNSNGSRVFAGDGGSNNVYELDAASETLVGTLGAMGPYIGGVSVDQANRLLAVSSAWRRLSIFDSAAGTLLGTVDVGTNPHQVAGNPRADRAYVTDLTDSIVTVVDTGARTVVARSGSGGLGPTGVALGKDATTAYIVNNCEGNCSTGGNVAALDTSTNVIIRTCSLQSTNGGQLQAAGDFITKSGPASTVNPPSLKPYPVLLCPPSICRMVALPEELPPCWPDYLQCLPQVPCDPTCEQIDCCGLRDPTSLDRPGIFVAMVDGGRVGKSHGVEIRAKGKPAFVPLEVGTMVHAGDLLLFGPKSELELAAKGAKISLTQGVLPAPAKGALPWQMLIEGPDFKSRKSAPKAPN